MGVNVILTRYLIYIILKNQLIAFIVLFLVFFSQKFVRIFSTVADSSIPKFVMCILFGLGFPEVIKLILPISLFFAILVTFNYLHINHEIIAMCSCGLGYTIIVRCILFVSSVTTIFSIVNILFFSPWSLYYQNKLLLHHEFDFSAVRLFDRKFQFLKSMNATIFFIDSVYYENHFFKDMFLFVGSGGRYSIIVANSGYTEKCYPGDQWLILEHGNYYSWNRDTMLCSDVYINHFDYYKFLINKKKRYDYKYDNSVTAMSIYQLWDSDQLDAKVELHWRVTLIIIGFVMAMIIFPLSLMKLNTSYLSNIFPAVILYIVFFLIQIFLRASVSKGSMGLIWMWIVNLFYVCVAIVLNIWDSVFVRNFRWKVKLFFYDYYQD